MLQQMIKYSTEVFHHKQNAVICYMFALYMQKFAQLGSISYSVCLSTSNVYKLGNSTWRRSFYTLRCITTVVIISKLSQFAGYFQIFLYSRVRKLKRCFSILRIENQIKLPPLFVGFLCFFFQFTVNSKEVKGINKLSLSKMVAQEKIRLTVSCYFFPRRCEKHM